VSCSASRVVPGAHQVVGPGTHRSSGPREVHTTGRSIDLQLLVVGVEEEGRGEEDRHGALLGRPEVGTAAVHCRGWLGGRRRRAVEEARGRDSDGVEARSAGRACVWLLLRPGGCEWIKAWRLPVEIRKGKG
jgi:hypothetical protein